MKIELNNVITHEQVELELNILSCVSQASLWIVFMNQNETFGLESGGESRPYSRYYVRKVNHLLYASTTLDETTHDFTFASYFSMNELHHFLIKQSYNEHICFSNVDFDDNIYTRFEIFDWDEYRNLSFIHGNDISLEEYIKKDLFNTDRDITYQNNVFYDVSRSGENENFVTDKGFDIFLSEQEQL